MSKSLMNIIAEEKKRKRESPKVDLKANKEKVDKFSKLIKELHPPKVSKILVQEMKVLKEAVINPRDVNKKIKCKEFLINFYFSKYSEAKEGDT